MALFEGNRPVTGEFLSQMLVTRSFDIFFDLRFWSTPEKKFELTIATAIIWEAIALIKTSMQCILAPKGQTVMIIFFHTWCKLSRFFSLARVCYSVYDFYVTDRIN